MRKSLLMITRTIGRSIQMAGTEASRFYCGVLLVLFAIWCVSPVLCIACLGLLLIADSLTTGRRG